MGLFDDWFGSDADEEEDKPMPVESFDFSESLEATVNPLPKVVEDAPRPGTAVVVVLSNEDKEILKDTLVVNQPAPAGPAHIAGKPATLHRVGPTNRCHQEVTVSLDANVPFQLPDYVLDKRDVGGPKLRILWSCE